MRFLFILALALVLNWVMLHLLIYAVPDPKNDTVAALGLVAAWLIGVSNWELSEWFHDTVIENMIR